MCCAKPTSLAARAALAGCDPMTRQVAERKTLKNRALVGARENAWLMRRVVTYLCLSLEAVDTKDKYDKVNGVGNMVRACVVT